MLCDKYDAVKLVRKYISEWIANAKERTGTLFSGHEEWLFIAWVFSEKEIYESLSKHLVSTVTTSETGECLNTMESSLGETMPPGAIGK